MDKRKAGFRLVLGLKSDRSIKEKSACHSHRAFFEVSQRSAAGGSPEHLYMGINSLQPPETNITLKVWLFMWTLW
jgi:hypothetical protein